MAQLSNNPWLGVSSGAEALARDPRMTGQPDVGPMDLGVSGNAGYQVAHGGVLGDIGHTGGGILEKIGKFLEGVGVPGSPSDLHDLQGTRTPGGIHPYQQRINERNERLRLGLPLDY